MGDYLTIFKNKNEVESMDRKLIPCNYRKHPAYSANCSLCNGLHYVFVNFAKERSYSKGYEVRKAINLFLDYKIEYDSQNPAALRLDDLA